SWNGGVSRRTTIGSGRCWARVIWSRERKPRFPMSASPWFLRRRMRTVSRAVAREPRGAWAVVAGGLGDAGKHRGHVRVVDRKRGEAPAEIIFRCPGKSVLAIAH